MKSCCIAIIVCFLVVAFYPASSLVGKQNNSSLSILYKGFQNNEALPGPELGYSEEGLRQDFNAFARISVHANNLKIVRGYHIVFSMPQSLEGKATWECGTIFTNPLKVEKYEADTGLHHVWVALIGDAPYSTSRKAFLGDLLINSKTCASRDISCVSYEFADQDLQLATYDQNGISADSDFDDSSQDSDLSNLEINEFAIYPNPFNATTRIALKLGASALIKIVLYNIAGCEVKRLLNKQLPAGLHQIFWKGDDNNNVQVASGVYFCKIIWGNEDKVARIVLIR